MAQEETINKVVDKKDKEKYKTIKYIVYTEISRTYNDEMTIPDNYNIEKYI